MLSRWMDVNDPFSMMNALEKQMNQIFDTSPRRAAVGVPRGVPDLTLEDRGDALVLVASLPGLRREELELGIEGDLLTLKGERKHEPPEGYRYVRAERAGVRMHRQFELPCRVDAEGATADLSHGVLTVTLPKAPDAKPRKIAITSGPTHKDEVATA